MLETAGRLYRIITVRISLTWQVIDVRIEICDTAFHSAEELAERFCYRDLKERGRKVKPFFHALYSEEGEDIDIAQAMICELLDIRDGSQEIECAKAALLMHSAQFAFASSLLDVSSIRSFAEAAGVSLEVYDRIRHRKYTPTDQAGVDEWLDAQKQCLAGTGPLLYLLNYSKREYTLMQATTRQEMPVSALFYLTAVGVTGIGGGASSDRLGAWAFDCIGVQAECPQQYNELVFL